MTFKTVLALCVMIAVTSAVSGTGTVSGSQAPVNPFASIPSWLTTAPWFPKWSPCSTIGKTCRDCNTKMVCTGFGGLQIVCSDPTLPYCNLGECSATPSDECAVPAVPANTAA